MDQILAQLGLQRFQEIFNKKNIDLNTLKFLSQPTQQQVNSSQFSTSELRQILMQDCGLSSGQLLAILQKLNEKGMLNNNGQSVKSKSQHHQQYAAPAQQSMNGNNAAFTARGTSKRTQALLQPPQVRNSQYGKQQFPRSQQPTNTKPAAEQGLSKRQRALLGAANGANNKQAQPLPSSNRQKLQSQQWATTSTAPPQQQRPMNIKQVSQQTTQSQRQDSITNNTQQQQKQIGGINNERNNFLMQQKEEDDFKNNPLAAQASQEYIYDKLTEHREMIINKYGSSKVPTPLSTISMPVEHQQVEMHQHQQQKPAADPIVKNQVQTNAIVQRLHYESKETNERFDCALTPAYDQFNNDRASVYNETEHQDEPSQMSNNNFNQQHYNPNNVPSNQMNNNVVDNNCLDVVAPTQQMNRPSFDACIQQTANDEQQHNQEMIQDDIYTRYQTIGDGGDIYDQQQQQDQTHPHHAQIINNDNVHQHDQQMVDEYSYNSEDQSDRDDVDDEDEDDDDDHETIINTNANHQIAAVAADSVQQPQHHQNLMNNVYMNNNNNDSEEDDEYDDEEDNDMNNEHHNHHQHQQHHQHEQQYTDDDDDEHANSFVEPVVDSNIIGNDDIHQAPQVPEKNIAPSENLVIQSMATPQKSQHSMTNGDETVSEKERQESLRKEKIARLWGSGRFSQSPNQNGSGNNNQQVPSTIMASQMYQAKEQGTAYQGEEDEDDESMEEETHSNQFEQQEQQQIYHQHQQQQQQQLQQQQYMSSEQEVEEDDEDADLDEQMNNNELSQNLFIRETRQELVHQNQQHHHQQYVEMDDEEEDESDEYKIVVSKDEVEEQQQQQQPVKTFCDNQTQMEQVVYENTQTQTRVKEVACAQTQTSKPPSPVIIYKEAVKPKQSDGEAQCNIIKEEPQKLLIEAYTQKDIDWSLVKNDKDMVIEYPVSPALVSNNNEMYDSSRQTTPVRVENQHATPQQQEVENNKQQQFVSDFISEEVEIEQQKQVETYQQEQIEEDFVELEQQQQQPITETIQEQIEQEQEQEQEEVVATPTMMVDDDEDNNYNINNQNNNMLTPPSKDQIHKQALQQQQQQQQQEQALEEEEEPAAEVEQQAVEDQEVVVEDKQIAQINNEIIEEEEENNRQQLQQQHELDEQILFSNKNVVNSKKQTPPISIRSKLTSPPPKATSGNPFMNSQSSSAEKTFINSPTVQKILRDGDSELTISSNNIDTPTKHQLDELNQEVPSKLNNNSKEQCDQPESAATAQVMVQPFEMLPKQSILQTSTDYLTTRSKVNRQKKKVRFCDQLLHSEDSYQNYLDNDNMRRKQIKKLKRNNHLQNNNEAVIPLSCQSSSGEPNASNNNSNGTYQRPTRECVTQQRQAAAQAAAENQHSGSHHHQHQQKKSSSASSSQDGGAHHHSSQVKQAKQEKFATIREENILLGKRTKSNRNSQNNKKYASDSDEDAEYSGNNQSDFEEMNTKGGKSNHQSSNMGTKRQRVSNSQISNNASQSSMNSNSKQQSNQSVKRQKTNSAEHKKYLEQKARIMSSSMNEAQKASMLKHLEAMHKR